MTRPPRLRRREAPWSVNLNQRSENPMATIHKEIEVERNKEFVWDAIRDVGAIHKRLVPGFVVDCTLEGDSRIVTFANGMVVRELIVDVTMRRADTLGRPAAGPSLTITRPSRFSQTAATSVEWFG
jgi:hypothetical protein